MYGLAIIDILSLSGPGRSGYLSTFKGIPIYIHMIFDVQKKLQFFITLKRKLEWFFATSLERLHFKPIGSTISDTQPSSFFIVIVMINIEKHFFTSTVEVQLLRTTISVAKRRKKIFLDYCQTFPIWEGKITLVTKSIYQITIYVLYSVINYTFFSFLLQQQILGPSNNCLIKKQNVKYTNGLATTDAFVMSLKIWTF